MQRQVNSKTKHSLCYHKRGGIQFYTPNVNEVAHVINGTLNINKVFHYEYAPKNGLIHSRIAYLPAYRPIDPDTTKRFVQFSNAGQCASSQLSKYFAQTKSIVDC